MGGEKIRIIGLTIVVCVIFFCGIVSGLPPGFCLPENNTLVLGVFAPEASASGEELVVLDDIKAFSQLLEKKPAIGVFSDEWMIDRKFPLAGVTTMRNEGMIPYIRLMMRSTVKPYQKEPLYTLKNIVLGKYDGELRSWARDARSFGSPVIIEYGTEINQWSYPWNGYWNGNVKGQDLFRDAYRHIVSIMKEEGASNLIWVYSMNAQNQPDESWNNATSYYPGDEYCDMLAISIFGTKKPFETGTQQFQETMDKITQELNASSIHKPIMIIAGTDVQGQFVDPASWVTNAISSISHQTWPDVKGLIWFNSAWKNDNNPLHDSSMRLQDNASVSEAFKSALRIVEVADKLTC